MGGDKLFFEQLRAGFHLAIGGAALVALAGQLLNLFFHRLSLCGELLTHGDQLFV